MRLVESLTEVSFQGISVGQKDEKHSLPKWRAELRKSGNPYAAHYYGPEVPHSSPTQPARQQLRALENPYAHDYYLGVEKEVAITESSLPESIKPPTAPQKSLSKADFESGCRSIFRRYMPEMERTKLRSHHQDFIRRNVNCSSPRRFALLEELRRYDLSSEPGLRTYFNREEDTFTEAKLVKIEESVKEE
jgi:hypothetical protein